MSNEDIMNNIEVKKKKIRNLLEEVYEGNIVLPDFQRSFVWEPNRVRELLVSVLAGYFIGSMLVLEDMYKEESPFALRLIEGVEKVNKSAEPQSIIKILLDGQQRVTALFYALYEPDIPLKGGSPYIFFLNIDKALEKKWDEAVIAVSKKNKKKFTEIQKRKDVIPFSLLRSGNKELQLKIEREYPHLKEKFWNINDLANNFMNREIHIFLIPRPKNKNLEDSEKDRYLEIIVETFEKLNRTGKPLSIFELSTARFYKYGIKLRDLIEEAKNKYEFAELISLEDKSPIPPEYILKVIALLQGKEPRGKNLFELNPENFIGDWERACNALEMAYKRITDIKNGYGVLDFKKWMPYTTMIVPLAAILDFIKTKKLENKKNYEKIDSWYWVSVFSDGYDQAVDTKSTSDFNLLKEWIEDDSKVPDFIQKFDPKSVDLDADKQSSAIYRGVINMIVLQGALDFKTGQPPQFDKEKVQDDHIFPKSIFKDNRIVNRTLISTNAQKSNKNPSVYFSQRLKEHGKEKLKEILKSHLIPEDALDDLLNDNHQSFVEKRKIAIIKKLCELAKIEEWRKSV